MVHIHLNCGRNIAEEGNFQIILAFLYSLYREFSLLIGYCPQIGTFDQDGCTGLWRTRPFVGDTTGDRINVGAGFNSENSERKKQAKHYFKCRRSHRTNFVQISLYIANGTIANNG